MKSVCERFVELATEAIEAWDGQDNGDLLRLLSEHLGLSLFEMRNLITDLMEKDAEQYQRETNT